MLRSSYPGIYLQEVPGLFHSTPGVPTEAAGPIALLDSRNLPFKSDSVPVGGNPSSQPGWQYINVRRIVIYIEQSLIQGVQWVVFQNNNPALWLRVANSIDSFLMNQWLQGSLQGKKKQEAYFVRCDSSTMSQNDLDNGRLVALIGFAPVRPAEFIVIQIGVQTSRK
jgi:tail sheath protein